jgi:hypothetical protein
MRCRENLTLDAELALVITQACKLFFLIHRWLLDIFLSDVLSPVAAAGLKPSTLG